MRSTLVPERVRGRMGLRRSNVHQLLYRITWALWTSMHWLSAPFSQRTRLKPPCGRPQSWTRLLRASLYTSREVEPWKNETRSLSLSLKGKVWLRSLAQSGSFWVSLRKPPQRMASTCCHLKEELSKGWNLWCRAIWLTRRARSSPSWTQFNWFRCLACFVHQWSGTESPWT